MKEAFVKMWFWSLICWRHSLNIFEYWENASLFRTKCHHCQQASNNAISCFKGLPVARFMEMTVTKMPIRFLIFLKQLCHVTSSRDWVYDITHWGCPPGQCPSHGFLASSNTPRSNAAPAPIDGALWSRVCLFYRLAGCELCYAAPLRLWREPLCFHESYLTNGNNGACYISNRTNTKLEKHKAGVHNIPWWVRTITVIT